MTVTFAEQPILNSPYEYPSRHWELEDGVPTDRILERRRESEYVTPVPPPRRRVGQTAMTLGVEELSDESQEYDPTPIINLIRERVHTWRAIPDSKQWGVTAETERLLKHWRQHEFQGIRPFFCQIEAVETVIWLTEVAGIFRAARPRAEFRGIHRQITGSNAQANPELLRLALKLATGAGKTTVMAMLIAWQVANAVRSPNSRQYTKGFLVVTPGITIRDRLRVLLPNDPENYYEHRDLVPKDMLGVIRQAQVFITNYHSFKLREKQTISSGARRLLQGEGGKPLDTLETEGQMLRRVMPNLMGFRRVMVLNDEGHHCYREKADGSDEGKLTGDDRVEAKNNAEAARLWINGIETVKRNVGTVGVIDLSATPFFLRGSGYVEGTLFPWTVCDFSLMDAIESGIVKIPRAPVSDNLPGDESPIFRRLWERIRDRMPKARRRPGQFNDPLDLPPELLSALDAIYGQYEQTFRSWESAGVETPPVFIVVCNNTATSKLIYDYMSGFEYPEENSAPRAPYLGKFELFRNYREDGTRRSIPRALLIDSEQLESGEALPKDFREMSTDVIERFKREARQRSGDTRAADNISDEDLLREVMNTVGKKGQLGGAIRCVVSVSMLTEGWDANTVTHILGVRAFGTQLLCEQVVGRALRRQSYDLNEDGLFDVEYADVLGVPFDFTAKPVVVPPTPPKPTARVHAVSPERERLEIKFPRVVGYRVELPDEKLSAQFNSDSALELNPYLVGPSITNNQGIVGEGVELNLERLRDTRMQTIEFELAKHIVETQFRETGQPPKTHLFPQVRNIVRRWLSEGYLRCVGNTYPAQTLYREISDMVGERIKAAISDAMRKDDSGGGNSVKAILDPYTSSGSTRFVNFTTSKTNLWQTSPSKCHVNMAVCDSHWETEFCRVVERHPKVLAYVKNQGLGLEVPYTMGSVAKTYIPDFIIQVDDGYGSDNPLNLVVEIKGYRGEDAKIKASTMRSYWIPGVNNLGGYGYWAFHEFTSPFEMQSEFDDLIGRLVNHQLDDYESLNFKEMLAACPIDGIEITRMRDFPKDIEF